LECRIAVVGSVAGSRGVEVVCCVVGNVVIGVDRSLA
jgi:hypothetical protein